MAFFQFAKATLKNMLSKPATLMYPVKPAKKFKNTRGKVVNDINKCIFCGNCSRKCPAVAICVDMKARTWEIDKFRCIACNCCVEVCPVKSLSMDTGYNAPTTEKTMKTSMQGPPKPEKKSAEEKKD